ncbi:MAG: OmpA family protein, partial [Bacteroidales bacterium]|nr:OmpA family protein [Bacteroidales bacterium]
PESIIALKHLLDVLNDNPQIVIELSSHTDYRQGTIDNEELSQRRAQSVVDYLIAQGVNPKRLAAKGYAATQPKQVDLRIAKLYGFLHVGTKLTPEFIDSLPAEQREICHQINRRTEFRVITTNF